MEDVHFLLRRLRRIPFQWNFKQLLQQCSLQALKCVDAVCHLQLLFLKEVSITALMSLLAINKQQHLRLTDRLHPH